MLLGVDVIILVLLKELKLLVRERLLNIKVLLVGEKVLSKLPAVNIFIALPTTIIIISLEVLSLLLKNINKNKRFKLLYKEYHFGTSKS